MPDKIAQLQNSKAVRVEYLQSLIVEEDWHGLMDAAADIREIEAEIKGILYSRIDKYEKSESALTR